MKSVVVVEAPPMHPLKFWTPIRYSRVTVAQNFKELTEVALDILRDMPRQPIVQVCGSLTSGGRSLEENIKIFQSAIEHLCNKNWVFNQLPFEPKTLRMIGARSGTDYTWDLMNEFYLPIFQSGYIKTLFFLRGWKKSTGASWEHDRAVIDLKIPTFYLDDEFQIHSTPLD